jgi:quercetin dioxygenase-like cupin family protein
MLTRRTFTACALCTAGGFLATGALATEAQAQTPGFKRTLLKQTDGPVDGYATIEMRVEIDPDVTVPRHTHPGIETGYVADGGLQLTIEGQGALDLKPGDGFQVPTGTPHGGPNGPAKTVVISTYVVEKGKPLASPA